MPKQPDQQKSLRRAKKEATQEFFNKKRTSSAGQVTKTKESFTFNKAPINKNDAKKEMIEEREKRPAKRSAFTAKLYNDDNELEQLKVLAGDQFDSDVDENGQESSKKKPRDAKALSKQKQDFSAGSKPLLTSKLGRLNLTKGSVAMFAVSEIHIGQYAIVSHTRNVKGYISLKSLPDLKLKVGQLIVASVVSIGLGVNDKGLTSNKLQLSIDQTTKYQTLQVSKITPGMFLQSIIESKEEKGYFLNLGFKDGAKGFLKFETGVTYEIGDLVNVVVISSTSKLVKCSTDIMSCVQSTESVLVTEHTLKAGFLVNSKVAKIYENGIELSFLGGMTGTVFVDHTGRENVSKFKVGEKLQARCISHDISTKTTTMSLLPHIISLSPKEMCEPGSTFEKVKVYKKVFGDSYLIKLPGINGEQIAFLHKSHLPGAKQENQEEEEEQDPNAPKKKVAKPIDELTVGQVIEKVRVKELNYFDGVAQLTMRQQIVNSVALDYSGISVGQFVNATIESVNTLRKSIQLSLNDFVKGTLKIEHMADYPIQVIPPKYTQTGKQIKVRVFSVDERNIVFTKKDTLMKHDVPLFKSLKSVKKGDKVIGVIVSQNEYGFIVKSFGEVKGILTFVDVKENQSKREKTELKAGQCVKTYVLFNKKGSGLALTLDKKKARVENQIKNENEKSFSELYLPSEEEFQQIKESYSSYQKHSQDCVGKTFTWKVSEIKQNYLILKTVLEKKTKFAILPKPLSHCFGLSLPFDQTDFTFEGYVFQEVNQVPIVSFNPILQKLQTLSPSSLEDLQPGKAYLGVIESISETLGLQLRFPTFNSHISIKDMQHTSELINHYEVGMPLICAHNKAGRLSCKDIVINNVLTSDQQAQHKQILLNAFAQLQESSVCGFKIGQQVNATVQLVKDYGLIVQIDSAFTGFILNDQKSSSNVYKVGQKLNATILDVDFDKKIIDLSEKLSDTKLKNSKPLSDSKAQVELIKDNYMIVRMKDNKFGVCLVQSNINDLKLEKKYATYTIGDQIEVRQVPNTNSTKSELQLLTLKTSAKQTTSDQTELKEGLTFNGVLKSIKGNCMYVQVGSNGRIPQIGRLHRIESQTSDFSTMKVGDRILIKVLKITQDNEKTMIELTRRKEHLDLPSGRLNEQYLALLSLETIKEGQQLQALITDVTPEASSPIQIQISPFVHGQILFSDVVSAEQLKITSLTKILSQYKEGQFLTVYYRAGNFTLQLNDASMKQLKRGDLCVARYVKIQPGYGITVQMNRHSFGMIELCELTDEIQGGVAKHMKAQNLFLARVIDTDKKGRLMLSSRHSVIENWNSIVGGSTVAFQQFDSKNQKQGNLRNKIIKFGPKLAVSQNDLFTGYVTNISKAGCFIQIGHNCSLRVGLNELDDAETFDFSKQMPIGRQVVGRITKCIDMGDQMRFNASLRKSLVLYGVGLVNRNQLKIGDQHTAFVLAISADIVFAQLNGSYLKVSVKGAPIKSIQIGSLIEIKITKTDPENIKAEFQSITKNQEQDQNQEIAQVVYNSVQEESKQDIIAAQDQKDQQEIDIEQVVSKKRQMNAVEQQIHDLETIAQIENQEDESVNEESGNDDDEEMEDSDEEAMKIIESKNYDDSDEEMKSDEEQGESDLEDQEDDDEEMESEQEDDSSDQVEETKLVGKKALRAQITQEKEIRAKEASMRSTKGANPQSANDFERLLAADQDQSYLWIQYMAFMLDKLDVEAARKVVERGVKSIGITAESDKLNLWIAYMNLENQFGDQNSLQEVTKRALEVNDAKKIYLQLINIYRSSKKFEYVEPIFKKLCKKYFESLEIWSSYIEFLFEVPSDGTITKPKVILQKSLQALPKHLHINIISKYGMLEYKSGQPESGRTMFEGIVTNYPKRMDIWSIYMDMEAKYGGKNNIVQARHLFERCLSLAEIQKKPKKMKLVFRKYMEFENTYGTKQKLDALRQRVEEYLEKAFNKQAQNDSSSESSDDAAQ